MDMLRELKGMELQLAELRTAWNSGRPTREDGAKKDA